MLSFQYMNADTPSVWAAGHHYDDSTELSMGQSGKKKPLTIYAGLL